MMFETIKYDDTRYFDPVVMPSVYDNNESNFIDRVFRSRCFKSCQAQGIDKRNDPAGWSRCMNECKTAGRKPTRMEKDQEFCENYCISSGLTSASGDEWQKCISTCIVNRDKSRSQTVTDVTGFVKDIFGLFGADQPVYDDDIYQDGEDDGGISNTLLIGGLIFIVIVVLLIVFLAIRAKGKKAEATTT